MTVKVGQVYRTPIEKYVVVVVQYKQFLEGTNYPIDDVIVIYRDGETVFFKPNVIEEWELLAEYDSWIEAVNSPEFKGEK